MNIKKGIVLIALIACLIFIIPASAAVNKISQGQDVFIGEEGLDISAAVGAVAQIAYWNPGSSLLDQPTAIITIRDPRNFYISPSSFAGKTGSWYRWDGEIQTGVAFSVNEPSLNLRIWDGSSDNDGTSGYDITGKSIKIGSFANFRIETNMVQIADRPGYNPADDGPFNIRVKGPDGDVYTSLIGSDGAEYSLTGLTIDEEIWYWTPKAGDHTRFPINDGWDTGTVDEFGNQLYKAGTYTAWIETNINGIKDNYGAEADPTGKTISAERSLTIETDQLQTNSNILEPQGTKSTPSVSSTSQAASSTYQKGDISLKDGVGTIVAPDGNTLIIDTNEKTATSIDSDGNPTKLIVTCDFCSVYQDPNCLNECTIADHDDREVATYLIDIYNYITIYNSPIFHDDGTSTKTGTAFEPDGTVWFEEVIVTDPDRTITKTYFKPDGTVLRENVIVTDPDGTITKTGTKFNPDGTV